MAKEVEDQRNVVGTVEKSDFLQIRVSVDSFKGYEFVSVREWYLPRNATPEDDFRPSQKGFTLPLDTLNETIEALIEALESARSLVNGEEAEYA